MIRVVIADDDARVRGALVDVLVADGRFTVVGSCGSGRAAVLTAQTEQVDVALLDVRMPSGGSWAARALTALDPGITVVAMSATTDTATVVALVRAGAAGFLAKGAVGADLPDLLVRAVSGERVLVVPNADAVRAALDDTSL